MNNQLLIDRLHKACADMSYYNAAEGSSWGLESQARGEAMAELIRTAQECREAGIDPIAETKTRNYLVTEYDLKERK